MMNFGGSPMSHWKYCRVRNPRGSVTATADLLIVVPLIVLGVVCLINACMVGFYKQKLTLISTQAASYAANLPPDVDPVKPTEKIIAGLIRRCELRGSDIKVAIKPVAIE